MNGLYELVGRFMALFSGLNTAYGTGRGQWIKRPPTKLDFLRHLEGDGPGIGIGPLRPDNTVLFAAIDLDEPDFEAAFEMQRYIPGHSFVERSRSGNAHVWVFFSEPCPAWLASAVLREAYLAAGKQHVEVFPKNHDFALVKLGNYINLPYHGRERPIVGRALEYTLLGFIAEAEETKNDPGSWQRRAQIMQLTPPSERVSNSEFGEQPYLHRCAEYIIAHAEDNPVTEGHRAAVFFTLAKCLSNWSGVDHDEALELMKTVNDASPDRIDGRELLRILRNAERGRFTSTGCDDPLVQPYADPKCPIAFPNRTVV
jgi:hypothetical protein